MNAETGYENILKLLPFLQEPKFPCIINSGYSRISKRVKEICSEIEADAYNKGFIDGQMKVAREGSIPTTTIASHLEDAITKEEVRVYLREGKGK